MCCAGDGQHVVHAHDGVGDDDGLDGRAEAGGGDDVFMPYPAILLFHVVRNPDQDQTTDEQKARNFQQLDDRRGECGANGDGTP